MSKKEFINLLDIAKEDQYGNLYIEGEYDNRIYFCTIETVCEDLIEKYCCKEEDGYELYDRHFWNDDTLSCIIVNKGDETMKLGSITKFALAGILALLGTALAVVTIKDTKE